MAIIFCNQPSVKFFFPYLHDFSGYYAILMHIRIYAKAGLISLHNYWYWIFLSNIVCKRNSWLMDINVKVQISKCNNSMFVSNNFKWLTSLLINFLLFLIHTVPIYIRIKAYEIRWIIHWSITYRINLQHSDIFSINSINS